MDPSEYSKLSSPNWVTPNVSIDLSEKKPQDKWTMKKWVANNLGSILPMSVGKNDTHGGPS